MMTVAGLLAVVILPFSLTAQIAFDVSSVKSSAPAGDTYRANLGTALHGEVTLENATLADCIKFAYGLVSDLQLSGQDWIFSKQVRFDIIGKAPPATSRPELLLMLRTLLDERFRLQMHVEKKKIPHYALVTSKNGSKLHEVQPQSTPPAMTYATGRIVHPEIAMQTLALLLSRQMREMVLDETGLKGLYPVNLIWTPDTVETEQGPGIFTAVQEQLGLKLELSKDPVDVRIVEHAERVPVAN